MSINYFFVSLLIITSCTNKEYISLAQLSSIKERFTLYDTSLIKVNSSTKYISKSIEVQIDSALNINSQYLALAKFDVPSVDSGKIRPYELVLLYNDTAAYSFLITIDKLSNKLIDLFVYDTKIRKLKSLYPVSSSENHDAIAVEILEDKSNSNYTDLKLYRLDITNKGSIEYKYTMSDLELIFLGLDDNCEYCGIYASIYNEVSVRVEIRQGLKPNTLAYLLVVTSPAECSEHYRYFEGELLNGVLFINDHIEMLFTQNNLSLKLKEYKNGCDELQSGGNFIVKKKQ